jgi:hypothetical protein
MTPNRLLALAPLVAALVVAACSSTGASGSAGTSASAEASAPASAAASAEASATASAEASAAASASAEASAGAGGGDLASKIPTTVGDITMATSTVDGEAYVVANVSRHLAPILTALNKTPTDVTVVQATGAASGGQTLFIDAVQIAGADVTSAMSAFQTAAEATPGETVKTSDMGGKSVIEVTTSSYTLAVYGSGDTLFYVQSPDPDLVSQGVAALPV